jgi:hypothetical protein
LILITLFRPKVNNLLRDLNDTINRTLNYQYPILLRIGRLTKKINSNLFFIYKGQETRGSENLGSVNLV